MLIKSLIIGNLQKRAKKISKGRREQRCATLYSCQEMKVSVISITGLMLGANVSDRSRIIR